MISERLKQSQEIVRRDFYPHFEWIENDPPVVAQPGRPLSESRIAYVTSCGLYRKDTQLPFDAYNHLGDPSLRELHIDTPPDRIDIAHTHFRHEFAEQDSRILFPVEHLRQMAEAGQIGELYPWVYSFMGFMPEPRQFMAEAAPRLLERFKQERVDAVLFTPC